LFDRLLLLKSGGKVVYQAPIGPSGSQLVSYLEAASQGTQKLPQAGVEVLADGSKKVTLRQSPANWMLDVITQEGSTATGGLIDYATAWKESALWRENEADISQAEQTTGGAAVAVALASAGYAGTWTRYAAVQQRMFLSHWRNAAMNVTRLFLMLGFAVVLGGVYYHIFREASDFGGVNSTLAVIFLGLAFPASICAAGVLPTLFRQRPVYYRETTIGLYGSNSFVLAVWLAELPYLLLCVAVFLAIFYPMCGFVMSIDQFAKFALMAFLTVQCLSAFSALWLALMPNQIAANVANGLVMNLFFMVRLAHHGGRDTTACVCLPLTWALTAILIAFRLCVVCCGIIQFAGLFIKPGAIPKGWKWSVTDEAQSFSARSLVHFRVGTTERGPPQCWRVG